MRSAPLGPLLTTIGLTASIAAAASFAESFVTPVLLREVASPVGVSFLGASVSSGDLDGDGVPDLAVGAPVGPGGGAVSVHSVADGRTLLTLSPPAGSVSFGDEVDVIGDASGDGVPDLLIADSGIRSAYLFSGADGSRLPVPAFPYEVTVDAGVSMDAVGDVNGDGRADFVIARRGVLHGADVFSGATGEILMTFDPGGLAHVGTSANMGDLDGDGVAEVAVSYFGATRVYSAATGQALFSVPAYDVVASADVDGDGRRELLVSQGSQLFVYSSTGVLLDNLTIGSSPCCYSRVGIAGVGDLDGDGCEEFAASVATTDGAVPGAGTVAILSGASRSVLARLDGVMINEYVGWSLDGLGDVDGDGIPDLLVGVPGARNDLGAAVGAARLYRLHPGAAPIGVDLLPGHPNVLRAHGNNPVEVALFSSPDLDMARLDPSSVRLSGIPPLRERGKSADLGSADPEDPCASFSSVEDGLVDRTFVFGAAAVRAAIVGGFVTVTAQLDDGRHVAGEACASLAVSAASPDAIGAERRSAFEASPNPIHPGESSRMELGPSEPADWAVYDVRGRRVTRLAPTRAGGSQVYLTWDGRDDQGAAVAPGVYFVCGDRRRMAARVVVVR